MIVTFCFESTCIEYLDRYIFINDPATTDIYTYCHTLSLHDALPISAHRPVLNSCNERLEMSESAIRLDLVTPELLTQMLAPRWPGIRVTGIELLHAIPGTATKLRLRLQYADKPADAPETLWLKGGLEAHSVDYAALYASEGEIGRAHV